MKSIIKPATPGGTHDFLPQEMARRNYMVEQMKQVFLRFGYDTIQTPVLEYAGTLLGKYGTENSKKILTFQGREGRSLAFRYDQTVPFARFVAAHYSHLPMPFKRYQIARVWREEENTRQHREFYQCDIDIIGTDSLLAECEIIKVIVNVLKNLRLENFIIKFNTRQKQASREFEQFLSLCESFQIPKEKLQFDPAMKQGLSYYTGLMFKVVISDPDIEEVCTGGRYHDLCSAFCKKTFSGVGAAFHFDRLMRAMEKAGLFKEFGLNTKVLAAYAKPSTLQTSLKIVNELQSAGIPAEIYFDPKPLTQQIEYAKAKKIPFVVICQPSNDKRHEAVIKVMKTGKEKVIPQNQITAYLKGYNG